MIIGLPTVPPLDAERGLGTDGGVFESLWHGLRQRPDYRKHCRAGPPSGGWRKAGLKSKVLGVQKVAS